MSRRAVLTLAILLCASAATAQEPSRRAEATPWGPTPLTPEAVAEEHSKASEVPTGMPESDRPAFDAEVARRREVLDEIRRALEKSRALPSLAQCDQWAAESTMTLRNLEAAGEVEVPSYVTDSQFEAHEQELKELRTRRDNAEGRLKTRKAEIAGAPARVDALKAEYAALRGRLLDPESAEAGVLGEYRRATARMELRLLSERLDYETRLVETGARVSEVRELQVRVLGEQVRRKEEYLDRARSSSVRTYHRDLDALRKAMTADEDEIAGLTERLADPGIAPLEASRVRLRVFERRMSVRETEVRAARLRHKLFRLETAAPLKETQDKRNRLLQQSRDRLVARFEREERQGTTSRITDLLTANLARVREQRTALDDTFQPEVSTLLKERLLRRGEIYDQLWPLETQDDEQPGELSRLLESVDPSLAEDARAAFRRWSTRLRKALEEEMEELETGLALLLAVDDQVFPQRRDLLDQMESFILSRIYWVRSDDPVGVDTLIGIPREVAEIAKVYTRPALLKRLSEGYREGTWRFLATAAGFLLFLTLGVYLLRRLRRLGADWKLPGGALLEFLQRLALTLLLSSLAPICLAVAALLLSFLALPPAFAVPGGRLLMGLAVVMFARRSLWMLFREEGLAMDKFGATGPVAEQLLRLSRWATTGALCLVLPWYVLSSEPLGLVHLPRVLYSAVLAFYSMLLATVVRPRGALVQALTGGAGVFYRLWFVLSPFVTLGLLAIVAMDLLGYRFGSRLLIGNVIETFVGVLVLAGFYNLVTGVVHQTAARIRNRVRREEGDAAARERSAEALEQMTRLLTVGLIVAAVLLLAGSWGVARSLRTFFSSIHLYTVDLDAGLFLTLWDVLRALVWVGAGHFLILHLPGLFEVLLFARLGRVQAGTRFAVLTITKYLVVIVTYSGAVLALHLSFASLGYVIAALSVGIGFGLQEIVSNFISGLILFFERPIRVGDTITVAGTTGVVQRISIRSTELLNADRQVIVIPNRKFIGEEVVNWSHNDQIVRGTIEIGVAYGTDLAKTGMILLDIVKGHPRVLRDPAPKVVLWSFGESSLDFRVWPYTLIDDRIQVLHELRMEIVRRFEEEKIEIPFPQRDVHLKADPTSPSSLPVAGQPAPPPEPQDERDGDGRHAR